MEASLSLPRKKRKRPSSHDLFPFLQNPADLHHLLDSRNAYLVRAAQIDRLVSTGLIDYLGIKKKEYDDVFPQIPDEFIGENLRKLPIFRHAHRPHPLVEMIVLCCRKVPLNMLALHALVRLQKNIVSTTDEYEIRPYAGHSEYFYWALCHSGLRFRNLQPAGCKFFFKNEITPHRLAGMTAHQALSASIQYPGIIQPTPRTGHVIDLPATTVEIHNQTPGETRTAWFGHDTDESQKVRMLGSVNQQDRSPQCGSGCILEMETVQFVVPPVRKKTFPLGGAMMVLESD